MKPQDYTKKLRPRKSTKKIVENITVDVEESSSMSLKENLESKGFVEYLSSFNEIPMESFGNTDQKSL